MQPTVLIFIKKTTIILCLQWGRMYMGKFSQQTWWGLIQLVVVKEQRKSMMGRYGTGWKWQGLRCWYSLGIGDRQSTCLQKENIVRKKIKNSGILLSAHKLIVCGQYVTYLDISCFLFQWQNSQKDRSHFIVLYIIWYMQ